MGKHIETMKEINARKNKEQEAKLLELCRMKAEKSYGAEKVASWKKEFGDIFFLPILDETGEKIEAMAVMKPITRTVLSYASTKISEEGIYSFLETAMRECWIEGNESDIFEVEDNFIAAADSFQKIINRKKAAFLKA